MPSSVVADMIYNEEKQVLRIVFVSGAVYDYYRVPAKKFRDMQKASSKGTYLNKHIKSHYRYRKIYDPG